MARHTLRSAGFSSLSWWVSLTGASSAKHRFQPPASFKNGITLFSNSPEASGGSYAFMVTGLVLFSYPAVIALLTLSSSRTGLRRLRSAYLVAVAVAIWTLLGALFFFHVASQAAEKWLDVGFWGVLVASVLTAIMLRCAEWTRDRPLTS